MTAVTVFTHSSSLIHPGRLGRIYGKFAVKSGWHRMQAPHSKLHSWDQSKYYLNAAPPTVGSDTQQHGQYSSSWLS